MKKLLLIASLSALAIFLTSSTSGQPVLFKLSSSSSSLKWTSKSEETTHYGNLVFKSGNSKWDSQTLLSAYAIIDMQKITCTDIKDAGFNRELIVEMRSPEQLNLAKYKDAKIRINKAKRLDVEDGNPNYEVSGTVTLKGVAIPVSETISISKTKKSALLAGKFTLPMDKTDLPYDLELDFKIDTKLQK